MSEEDPHERSLAVAIAKGWSVQQRTGGGDVFGPECWVHTTSDAIVHLGWARTYCGIEVIWDNSRRGMASESTCEQCIVDFMLSQLDRATWLQQKEEGRVGDYPAGLEENGFAEIKT